MRIILSLFFTFFTLQLFAQAITGNDILDKMYARYGGKWHKSVSYIKEVQQYPDGQPTPKQYWYEAIQYPGDRRMDIGDVTSGNIVLLHSDTLYKFQNGKVVYGNLDRGDYLFLIGDMYSMPLDEVKKKLRWFDYDITKGTETVWNGTPVYVLGAKDTAEKVNQLWIDKDKLILLHSIEYYGGARSDIIFSDHVQLPGSWLETNVKFYQNGQLLQEEKYIGYSNMRQFSPDLFDPRKATTAKSWYEPGK